MAGMVNGAYGSRKLFVGEVVMTEMKFDLRYPRLLPLRRFGHVIVNVKTGERYESEEHSSVGAMMEVIKGILAKGEGQTPDQFGWTIPEMLEIAQFPLTMMSAKEKPKFENDLIRVGPYATWDRCACEKNSELITQRFEHFVERGGDLVTQIDREIAEGMRNDMSKRSSDYFPMEGDHEQGGVSPESLLAEILDPTGDKKVRTVDDVTKGKGLGLPQGLRELLSGLGKTGFVSTTIKEFNPDTGEFKDVDPNDKEAVEALFRKMGKK